MKRLVIGFSILAWFLLASPGDGAAQSTVTVRGKFQYAVKFVCGPTQAAGGGPSTGHYSTHVNIHNPGDHLTFAMKVATANGSVSNFRAATLGEDQADSVNCGGIHSIAGTGGGFLEGFLVIVTPKELDVTGLYTAEPSAGAGVTTLHTQVIQLRKLSLTVTAHLVP